MKKDIWFYASERRMWHNRCPPEISPFVGLLAPSNGHGIRLCHILRRETGNQTAFFGDRLRHAARFWEAPPGQGPQRFHRELRTASPLADLEYTMYQQAIQLTFLRLY